MVSANFRLSSPEHSAETYAQCLVVTLCYDPCALELTQLREIFPSTTAYHIKLEIFMIIYDYTFLGYI